MAGVLDQVSLVCANFGNGPAFPSVLEDWFEFLNGKPNEVVIVDGGSDATTRAAYLGLFESGKVDKLHLLQPSHRENDKERCFVQEYAAAAAAANAYVLFIKIDTLPFRRGHEDWLEQAALALEEPGVFAVSGALNRQYPWTDREDGWYRTHACTINFALMKRKSFIAALHEAAQDYIVSGFEGEHRLGRFLLELAFIEYQEKHGLHTRCRVEDESWTVFHTNAIGKDLLDVRQRFRARDGISEYMNPCLSSDITRFAYYGKPIVRGSASTRLRIAFGKTPAGEYWRKLKEVIRR